MGQIANDFKHILTNILVLTNQSNTLVLYQCKTKQYVQIPCLSTLFKGKRKKICK